MKQKVIIAIVAAIVIIGGIVLYMRHHKAAAPSQTETSTSMNSNEFTGDVPADKPDNSATPTSTTIAVSTQTPGSSVTIDNLFLDKPGFVEIHEVDAKGEPGAIIGGSSLLSAGAKQDLEIPVAVKAGMKYYAMLHEDNGDKKFNATSDKPVLVNGKPVMIMFSVSQ